MAHYIDASALVKLIKEESESRALRKFLESDPDSITSDISAIEVHLAARRCGEPDSTALRVVDLIDSVDRISLEDEIVEAACRQDGLKTLDAIHAATAICLRNEIDQVVVYDRQLSRALEAEGLKTVSPGLE